MRGRIILKSMSLEFAVQHPCQLRARYSEKHLREWGRLSNLHARLTTGDASAPSQEKLEWVENARDEIEANAGGDIDLSELSGLFAG